MPSRNRAVRLAAGAVAWLSLPVAVGAAPAPSARNLLVLTFDTTRADHLSTYGGEAKVPALDRLAREGLRFDRAFATTPITLPSHVSLFTGLYPAAHGVRNNGSQRLGENARTLAEMLQERGFRTGAVIAAQVLDSRYGLDQGFDDYDDRLPPEEALETLTSERRAEEVADLGIAWLESGGGERWFLWLHFFDPHWEYRPPEPYRSAYPSEPYDGEIAYAADQAERVIDWLRRRSRLDDTLVVATADHGESLGEHEESSHGIFLYDATMRIPLLLRHPGRLGTGKVRPDVASLVDVVPTALEVLGIDAAPPVDGRSLLREKSDVGRLVWMESWMPRLSYGWSELFAVRDAAWKYIRAPRPELYEVARDPGELHDLAAADPEGIRRWAGRMEHLETAIASGSTAAEERSLTPEERRQLESLGYASPGTAPSGLRADPKDRIGTYEKVLDALELVSREDWERAAPLLQQLVADNPDSSYLRQHLAGALRHTGREREGIRELERALRLAPEDFNLQTELGSMYLGLQDLGAAEAAFREAIRRNEHHAEAWHNLGLVAQQRGEKAEAMKRYERALQEDPNLLRTLVNLGTLYEEAGRAEEALSLYLRVADLQPGDPRALFSAAYLLFRAGRHAEAMQVLERARQADPGSPLPYLYRAQIHQALGDLDAMERDLRQALEVDPDSQEAKRALSVLERRRGAP